MNLQGNSVPEAPPRSPLIYYPLIRRPPVTTTANACSPESPFRFSRRPLSYVYVSSESFPWEPDEEIIGLSFINLPFATHFLGFPSSQE